MKPLPVLLALSLAALAAPVSARDESPALLVDPFVGTLADFGQLSPAAVAPFGMVQLAPDTDPANHAGYDHAARTLIGFSHTRGVGVGCGGAGGDLLVSLDYAGAPEAATIDKGSERAHAGRYHVRYGQGIMADLTATRGAGIIRFTLPQAGQVTLRADPAHAYSRRISSHWISSNWADLRAEMIAGTVCDVGRYRLFTASSLLHNGRLVTHPVHAEDGAPASITLSVKAGDTIELRTGLSSVDGRGAALTRDHELGNRAFAKIAQQTVDQWNRELSRITLDAPRDDKALFYTALFRALQTPVAIADPDGRYRGSNGAEKQVAPGHQYYTNWAMWDNYRTLMPLLALAYPERASDIAMSLTELYKDGKHRWATQTEPFLTVRTEHAGVALLDFHRRGIRGFDVRAALTGMMAESPGLARTTPDEQIEAAYDDWAIAELAGDLGEPAIAKRFADQALGYRTMWRDVFMTLGADADVVKARGLYQGTLWQYRWAPVFDLPWLIGALGPERFDRELEHFFADGLFNMTNQPDIHTPFLFALRGERPKTDALVNRILTGPIDHPYTNAGKRPMPWHGRSFALAPQGFADGMDDDAGGMSSWYVFATLGLYPLTPGQTDYIGLCPLHERARITLPGRKPLAIIRSPKAGPTWQFDGVTIGTRTIDHAMIARGGTLLVHGCPE